MCRNAKTEISQNILEEQSWRTNTPRYEGWTNKPTKHKDRILSSEIDPQIHNHLICDKGDSNTGRKEWAFQQMTQVARQGEESWPLLYTIHK